MKRFHRSLIFFVVVLLTSCSALAKDDPTQTDPVLDQTWQFTGDLRVSGRVVLSEPINLSFTTPGRLVDLLVNYGDQVKEGDVLARLEASQLQEAVVMAEANLDLAQAELDRLMMGANPAELLQAQNNLVIAEARVPISAADVTVKSAQVSTAQSQLDYLNSLPTPEDVAIAEAEVSIAKANLDVARARVLESVLIAPRDGTVNLISFKPYDFVGAGRTVLTLGDPTDLSVELYLDEIDVSRISVGDYAPITFVAIPGITVDGEVTVVAPNQEETSGNDFRIVLRLVDVPVGLRWGMTAEVYFGE